MFFWKNLSMKKKLITLEIGMIFFFFLFRADYTQQMNYEMARDAYRQMEQEHYETAAEEFQQYLDSHSSQMYWKLQAVVNQNDTYAYESVQKALEECREHLQKEG